MGGAIGAIGNIIGAIKPIMDVVGKFVPAVGQISSALSSFGQVSDVFKNLFSENDNAQKAAEDKGDKAKDTFKTITTAADTVNKFAGGDLVGGAKGVASLFA
ncbi:MAG: hypothetical protein FJZ01_19400 [Candidatus Sericytochromatia bacterium]|nr:hypothetical protein [Candidatus Tanganyikabacteria bacterium]